MTDEEKAEEYAEHEQCAYCVNPQYCQGKDECYDFANVKSHFLAGLKVGKDMAETDLATIAYIQGAERYKTKWHDVRNNPNDLPEPYTTVLDENSNRVEYIGHGKWQVYSEYYERYSEVDPPIAWCKIPIFIKKPVYNAEYRREQYTKHREKVLQKQKEYDDQHREEINRKARARYRKKCGLKAIKEAE